MVEAAREPPETTLEKEEVAVMRWRGAGRSKKAKPTQDKKKKKKKCARLKGRRKNTKRVSTLLPCGNCRGF